MTTIVDGQAGITFNDSSNQQTAGYTGFRNRIINGAMVIDQRNNGTSVTPTSTGVRTFITDRWGVYVSQASKLSAQQNAGSVTPPSGFSNYLGMTSLGSYSPLSSDIILLQQPIEGYNIADLAWGTSGARTVTLSFYVYSNTPGTYGGSLVNQSTRSYPFLYTISAANTWQYITIVIPGDTSGTYNTTNGYGVYLNFNLGTGSTYQGPAGSWSNTQYWSAIGALNPVATNAATLYITGVQFEKAAVATPFEVRQYGTELSLCQRYCCNVSVGFGVAVSATAVQLSMQYPVTMRAGPSTVTAPQGSARVTDMIAADFTTAAPAPAINNGDQNGTRITLNGFSGMTSGRATMMLQSGASAAPVQFSAEL